MNSKIDSVPINSCISIIIPVYNNVSELDRCLKSIRQDNFSRKTEIIVVDDCSSEMSPAIQQTALNYQARYHRQTENTGPGLARNCGATLASGDILAFIDADCIAPLGWLSKLTQPIRDGHCCVTTSCYSAPVAPSWITIFQNEDYLYRMPSIECDTRFVNSCNLAICRDLFSDCGGFPNQRVSEDMVLGWKLTENGNPARYLPNAGVKHDYCRNLISYIKQRFSFAFNTIQSYFDHKNLNSKTISSKTHSYNPVRTLLGIFFGFIFTLLLIFSIFIYISGSDLFVIFVVFTLIGLILEILCHGLFLWFLIKRQSISRSFSYIPLFYIVDMIYFFSVISSLKRNFYKIIKS